MKRVLITAAALTLAPAALTLAALILAALTLAGCGQKPAAALPVLDLEAAIDNPQPFDLTEIASEIEFIPLDDNPKEGLVGDISQFEGSKNRFYVKDNTRQSPVKIFDRSGRFLRAEGRFGRGPGEYTDIASFTADHDTDNLYMAVLSGVVSSSIVAYDPSGRELARNDSVMAGGMVVHDGTLLSLRSSMINIEETDLTPTLEMKPFLDIYSPHDLTRQATIDAPDRGLPSAISIREGGMINVRLGPGPVDFTACLSAASRSAPCTSVTGGWWATSTPWT